MVGSALCILITAWIGQQLETKYIYFSIESIDSQISLSILIWMWGKMIFIFFVKNLGSQWIKQNAVYSKKITISFQAQLFFFFFFLRGNAIQNIQNILYWTCPFKCVSTRLVSKCREYSLIVKVFWYCLHFCMT